MITSKSRRCLTQFYTIQMKSHFTDITHYPRIPVQTRCVQLFSWQIVHTADGADLTAFRASLLVTRFASSSAVSLRRLAFGRLNLRTFSTFLVVGTFGRGTRPFCGTTSISNETFSSSLIFSINDSKRGELITLPSLPTRSSNGQVFAVVRTTWETCYQSCGRRFLQNRDDRQPRRNNWVCRRLDYGTWFQFLNLCMWFSIAVGRQDCIANVDDQETRMDCSSRFVGSIDNSP